MTRQGRENRPTANAFFVGVDGYKSLFASIFSTSAVVDGLENTGDGLSSVYVVNTLYERGKIAFDKETGLWLPYSEVGRKNAYGEPLGVRLYGADGAQILRKRKDVYLFKANPRAFPWAVLVAQKCAFIADIDNALKQNLDGIKEMTIITAENELIGRILNAVNRQRINGESFATVTPALFARDENETAQASATLQNMQLFKTGGSFYLDRLKEIKEQEIDEIYHLLGVQTGYEKGERMTREEVSAYNGESNACMGVLLTTFNELAKAQGAPFRLRRAPAENETGVQ